MAEYITVDSGTTNTRINFVSDRVIVDTLKYSVGTKRDANGNNLLRETLKNGIDELMKRHKLCKEDITRILASGMITSEFGLIQLPHITAPAGIAELHGAMYETVFEDLSEIPFVFSRGIKTNTYDLENSDIMRGEETELMGIIDGEGVYILPGSHSKIIQVGKDERITNFKTMLTGEMISALSEYTTLKDAIDLKESKANEEYLLKGFEYADRHGINEALFKVRILKNILCRNADDIYGFFMGVILCNEIKQILSYNPKRIFIGGKKVIKESEALLLRAISEAETVVIPDESENASALGIVKVYEYRDETI